MQAAVYDGRLVGRLGSQLYFELKCFAQCLQERGTYLVAVAVLEEELT